MRDVRRSAMTGNAARDDYDQGFSLSYK